MYLLPTTLKHSVLRTRAIRLADDVCEEFRQGLRGMACLCSRTFWGLIWTQIAAGDLEEEGPELYEGSSLLCQVPGMECPKDRAQLGLLNKILALNSQYHSGFLTTWCLMWQLRAQELVHS